MTKNIACKHVTKMTLRFLHLYLSNRLFPSLISSARSQYQQQHIISHWTSLCSSKELGKKFMLIEHVSKKNSFRDTQTHTTNTLAKKKNYHQYHINWTYLSKRIFYFNLDFDHIQDRLTWKHNLDVHFFTSKWKQKYRSDYCSEILKLLRSLTVDNKKSQTNRFIFAVSNVIHKPTLYDI